MARPGVSPVVRTIHDQLLAAGIRGIRGGRGPICFVAWDEVTLKVSTGEVGVLIRYNRATDLYDVEHYCGVTVAPLLDDVPAEKLLGLIRGVIARPRRRPREID